MGGIHRGGGSRIRWCLVFGMKSKEKGKEEQAGWEEPQGNEEHHGG